MRDCFLNKKVKYVNWNVCRWLTAICLVVFMATNVLDIRIKGIPLIYWMSLVPNLIRFGFVWQFITYMFVHGSPLHLILNLYALNAFGRHYENDFGSIEFLIFFFTTGILGGVLSYLIYVVSGLGSVAVMGASGAIYALLFIQSVMYPNMGVRLFMFIPLRLPVAMIVFILIEIVSQLTGSGASVAHLVHLSSIAIAWLYSILRFRISPWKVWREIL